MCAGKKICQLLVQVISYPKWYGIKIFIQGFSVKSRFSILVQYYQQCRKRHLAFLVQILYGKIKKSKPCMNILMPCHFGQLMTCTKSWHNFFPAHIPLRPIFASPEPCCCNTSLFFCVISSLQKVSFVQFFRYKIENAWEALITLFQKV